MDYPNIKLDYKDYRRLVDQAENAFREGRYLEAFLVQSCIIEGVVKAYALSKLYFSLNKTLQRKFSNFEFARLLDELFIVGKITDPLYGDLNTYKKKRNKVIHNLLVYDEETLRQELISAYESGRKMKGFIVDDIQKDLDPVLRASEIKQEIAVLKRELEGYNKGSRAETATLSAIYNYYLELMSIADSDPLLEELNKIFPNFRRK